MTWRRKRIRIKVGIALGAAALAVTPVAEAKVKVSGVDATSFPRVRLTVVTSRASTKPPALTENGQPVSGLRAENLGRAKSVVLAVDRSRSMKGRPFADAVAAAQAFLRAKLSQDRVAIATFSTEPLMLANFSPTSADAQSVLRSLSVDRAEGTTLYDGVVKSARSFATETNAGRVVIVVTDGNETRSTATLDNAINAAREAGVLLYVVAIESKQFNPAPLRRLARDTGGSYRGAGSSTELRTIYAGIAAELRRTWRVDYLTAARPGDSLRLEASVPQLGAAASNLVVPGDRAEPDGGPSGVVPDRFYESFLGTQVVGALVGILVLLAGTFVLTSLRGSRLRRRLAPHLLNATNSKRKQERERLQAAAGLFRATETTFGHWRHWVKVDRLLERSDIPLRTVEFLYLCGGAGLAAGMIAGFAAQGTLVTLAAMGGAASVPVLFVAFKGKRRTNSFENQLPDLLITLAASLKAGHSFKTGLQTVVDEGRPPASKELKRVLTEAQLGRPIEEGLTDMAERLGSKNFEFVITAVTIQRQIGGSLAGLIDMVADTVRQRQQFARKIKGLTAMGRAGAYVLMGLPFFVALAITVMNGEYMDPLYHSSTGHKLIILMLVMMGFGSLLLRRLVSFKG